MLGYYSLFAGEENDAEWSGCLAEGTQLVEEPETELR